MNTFLKFFERFIVILLILIMVVIIVLATLDLGWMILKDIISSPVLLLDVSELLDVLGFVLLILIGIELLETIKAYLSEHIVHVEVVLEVALIAMARKVIVLDLKEYSGLTVLSVAALILALSAGYYLEKRSRSTRARSDDTGEMPVEKPASPNY